MEDLFKLAGKVAIVWGGGQGMGERSAMRLAEAGCDVTVVDVEIERAEQVCGQIRELGRRAFPYVADVTREDQVIAAVAASDTELGPVDCMVTVVGMAFWARLVDVTEEIWEKSFDVNLKSFFYTARAVANSIRKNGKTGSIVGVCSVSGLRSAETHGPYGAAKAGLANLVGTMGVEWGPDIRVNAIAPGAIQTTRTTWTQEAIDRFQNRVGLGRPGQADEIGKAALFLASDLSSYITGHTLPVDGGWMAEYLTRFPK